MRVATWLRRASWLGAFAVTIWIAPMAAGDEPPKPKASGDLGPAEELVPQVKRRVRIAKDLINDVQTSGILQPGKYSLKLSLSGVPKSLDAQLQLDGTGALVSNVTKGGPADKAGVEVYDILVTLADEPIKEIVTVIEAVNESEGKELHFKALRAGKPMVITIKPEVRQRVVIEEAARKATRKVEIEVRELEERLREKLKDAGVDLRMQVIQPGRFVPRGTVWTIEKPADFPEDLTIDVRKQGKDPAKIAIKQGDKSWTVTEDKLDELPEEVGKHVKALLGRAGPRYSYNLTMPKLSVEARKRGEEARKRARAAAEAARDRAVEMRERIGDRLEQRLDQMSREMKQMRERMEELRRSLRDKAERNNNGDEA